MTSIAYARITGITAMPDAVDAVIAVYRERSPSQVAVTPGLVRMFGRVNRPSRRVVGVTVWTSVAARDRNIVQRIGTNVDLSSYAPFMDGSFTHDAYDVTYDSLPTADPAQPFAPAVVRVTTEDLLPDGWDEGIATLRTLVLRLSGRREASGTILFENRRLGRAVVIQVASTSRELDTSLAPMREHDGAARRSGYLRRWSGSQVYEVIARY